MFRDIEKGIISRVWTKYVSEYTYDTLCYRMRLSDTDLKRNIGFDRDYPRMILLLHSDDSDNDELLRAYKEYIRYVPQYILFSLYFEINNEKDGVELYEIVIRDYNTNTCNMCSIISNNEYILTTTDTYEYNNINCKCDRLFRNKILFFNTVNYVKNKYDSDINVYSDDTDELHLRYLIQYLEVCLQFSDDVMTRIVLNELSLNKYIKTVYYLRYTFYEYPSLMLGKWLLQYYIDNNFDVVYFVPDMFDDVDEPDINTNTSIIIDVLLQLEYSPMNIALQIASSVHDTHIPILRHLVKYNLDYEALIAHSNNNPTVINFIDSILSQV